MSVIELVGILSTAIAIVGVVLNNRRLRACFVLWLASNAMTLGIHVSAGIWSLAVRDAIFFALAIEGMYRWKRR